MFLLDIKPDPIGVGGGIVGLILLVIVVLILVAFSIVGFVFLLKMLQRRTASRIASGNAIQPSSPNQ